MPLYFYTVVFRLITFIKIILVFKYIFSILQGIKLSWHELQQETFKIYHQTPIMMYNINCLMFPAQLYTFMKNYEILVFNSSEKKSINKKVIIKFRFLTS